MPLFFKLWFAFIFCIILTIMGATGYVAYSALQAGPEGLGRAIGSVIKGVNDASR